jgi:hypothetical protein
MSDWRGQCAELVAAWDSSAAEAANEARAELGLPEPKGPTDEELKTLAWKIYREAQEKDLRGDIAVRVCRAVLARWGNPRPAPKEPTDEEITDLLSWSTRQNQGPWPTQAHCVVRVALQLWGSPPIEPVAVSERLPGEEDCITNPRTGQGQWCWGWVQHDEPPYSGRWRMMRREWLRDEAAAWLPHHALPVPSSPTPETPC